MHGQTKRLLRRPFIGGCALLSAVALAVAGCGGDDESSEGDGAASGGTVNVGVLVPLTGELGAFGRPWQQAAELAIAEANETGALPNGARLKTVLGDEETNPETAVEQGRKMISTSNVEFIFGPTSGPMLALEPIAKRSRVPIISSAAGSVGLNNVAGEWLYRTVASDDADGRGMATFMVDEGAESAAVFVENDASPISVAQTFSQSFTDAGGSVSTEATLNPGQSSYRAEVGQVLRSDPEWVVCACGQQVGASVIKEMASAGYDGEWMVSADLVSAEALDAIGADVAEGAYGGIAESDTDLPAYQDFRQAYEDRFGSEPEPFTSNSYDAVALGVLAMIAADSTDGEEFNEHIAEVSKAPGTKVSSIAEGAEALQNGEEIDYDGASGPVDLENGTAASSFAIFQATDGKWKQVQFYPAEELAAAQE